MANVERSIDVNVPARTAYHVWTQFEELPRIFSQIKDVRPLGNRQWHWAVDIQGYRQQWDAEVTDETPDQRLSWKSVSGLQNAGTVTFTPLSDHSCLIDVQLEYTPPSFVAAIGDVLGMVGNGVSLALTHFKHYLEDRYTPSGERRTVEPRYLSSEGNSE